MAAAAAPPVFTVTDGGISLVEQDGNEFHLAVVLRKYTAAKLTVKPGVRLTVVENAMLWDALGLLRSLRHDVEQFNLAATPTSPPRPRAQVRYLCYRLMRQASSFGVRLPKWGEAAVHVRGLDELLAHVEGTLFAEPLERARRMVGGGVADFDSLGELFTPGAELVDHGAATGLFGVPMGARIRGSYFSRGKSLFGVVSTFYAACEFVVSVGDRFAVIEAHQAIPEFQGTRSVHDGMDGWIKLTPALKEELTRRGELYCQVAVGHSFVEHGPSSFLPTPRAGSAIAASSSVSRARSAGRMMVDVTAAWGRGVHCARTGGEACEAVVSTLKLVAQRLRAAASHTEVEHYSTKGSDAEEGSLDLLLLSELPPSLVWCTWPVVAGFSFSAKSWGVVMVASLKPVTFNEQSFDRLVLPSTKKHIIKALVLSHLDEAHASVDFIQGKGGGSIFLLHGPPGVGKTLTAEAVAELLHRPLYTVSMGELGTTPQTLESNLQDVLDLCVPWGALVLIDEAEMLLERRSKSEILRNAMVCVMLRLLEYFQGVLFLTSNRVEALDPAFQSRVQCALRYEALDAASRASVWKGLLEARGLGGLLGAGIDVAALAVHPLNGRQIKNTLQLAIALARHEGVKLAQSHLLSTLELATAFATDAANASDDFNAVPPPTTGLTQHAVYEAKHCCKIS
ncbi:hypothetical protein AB1Y20_002389 [Prymnesium parvum]|uniref:AAA+ ATPase domain-containing protein n=1 Tax=Prymnesium parvum TaxID=97485 RepID=A0AB34J8U5_PRYPA